MSKNTSINNNENASNKVKTEMTRSDKKSGKKRKKVRHKTCLNKTGHKLKKEQNINTKFKTKIQ